MYLLKKESKDIIFQNKHLVKTYLSVNHVHESKPQSVIIHKKQLHILQWDFLKPATPTTYLLVIC